MRWLLVTRMAVILINTRLSYASQLKAYEHAMRHIKENDFQKEDVQAIDILHTNLTPKKLLQNQLKNI